MPLVIGGTAPLYDILAGEASFPRRKTATRRPPAFPPVPAAFGLPQRPNSPRLIYSKVCDAWLNIENSRPAPRPLPRNQVVQVVRSYIPKNPKKTTSILACLHVCCNP